MQDSAPPHPGERRLALLLEYDGTAYCGSQHQENGPSIQQALESAINDLTGETARAAFAGRTDTGVHALGQVAAFSTRSRLGPPEFVPALNHFLPADIAVRRVVQVDPDFDPRRDARGRVYRYRIDNRAVRSPLGRNRSWHVPQQLDLALMARAARSLEGPHDFAAFAPPFDGRTQRTLRRCELRGCGGHLTLEMEAEAFLPHQVRRTIGTLVEVAVGRMSEQRLQELLDGAVASSAGPAAPGCGLYLVRVEYDGLELEPQDGNGQN